ncbi:MAG: RNA chaperone Hfq [Mycobacterium leprae]
MTKLLPNLQDTFLNLVRKESIPVTVYLVNGYQLKGNIRGFDNFTIVLEYEGKQQLVYKHALSTITPMRNVNINLSAFGGAGDEESQA